MFIDIIFVIINKEVLVRNLTVKEKNDLNEVHNCILVNYKFDFILRGIYKIINIFTRRLKTDLTH